LPRGKIGSINAKNQNAACGRNSLGLQSPGKASADRNKIIIKYGSASRPSFRLTKWKRIRFAAENSPGKVCTN